MALTFQEIKSLIDGQIGSVTSVTFTADSTLRGATSSAPSSGLMIRRTGEVVGSVSGSSLTITLEGGGLEWQGALTQEGSNPYFTAAQKSVVSLLTRYIGSMSNATIDNNTTTQG